MKNKELFDKTVGILVKAYVGNTLFHDNCAACGVGNIIREANGLKLDNIGKTYYWVNGDVVIDPIEWKKYFVTSKKRVTETTGNFPFKKSNSYYSCERTFTGKEPSPKWSKLFSSTGYTVFELAKIEFAFEFGDIVDSDEDTRQINGLMSVIDTLMQIHECTEVEANEAKQLFVKL